MKDKYLKQVLPVSGYLSVDEKERNMVKCLHLRHLGEGFTGILGTILAIFSVNLEVCQNKNMKRKKPKWTAC